MPAGHTQVRDVGGGGGTAMRGQGGDVHQKYEKADLFPDYGGELITELRKVHRRRMHGMKP